MITDLQIVILVLGLLYIAYIVVEYYVNLRARKKIGKVIHVNGIRGKSTTTRLIDAGLREFGYTVYGKTTGTIPTTINQNNQSKTIFRMGPANIREQLKIVRHASKCNADFLVVECMAVNPELQFISEHNILHADINVITNVRQDHLDKMGNDLESIAYSLANTVPKNGTVILGEDNFVNVFQEVANKQNATVRVALPYTGEDTLDTFPENIAVALEVASVLGLDRDKFFEGMKKYIHDPCAFSVFKTNDTVFINGFSVNDPDSTLEVYNTKIKDNYPLDKMTIVLNSRPDRLFRIDQHIEMLTKMQFKDVIIVGSNKKYVAKNLEKRGIKVRTISNLDELLNEQYIFGCGNIAKTGMAIVDYFKKSGVQYVG